MNFIEYCVATKNFSTLKAIDEYTKIFSTKAVKETKNTKANVTPSKEVNKTKSCK